MSDTTAAARTDRRFGLFWLALGSAIGFESWRMDRLEAQGINPLTAPGLVPGLLGVLLAAFGLALALRRPSPPEITEEGTETARAEPRRIGLALLLCLGFGGGVLGQGIPFWVSAAGFLFLAIFLFELPERRRDGTLARGAAIALTIAVAAAAAITFVFQEVFLVRLP